MSLRHSFATFLRAQGASIAAGVAAFIVVFGLVELLEVWYVYATAAGTASGAATTFHANRLWSFDARDDAWQGQGLRYLLVSASSLVLNTAGVWMATDLTGFHYGVSLVLVSVAVGFCFNHPLLRHFVFARRGDGPASGLRARDVDKQRALAHFDLTSRGAGYDAWASKGPLRYMRERQWSRVIQAAELDRPGLSLIDVGCGGGQFARYVKRAGCRVVAIDAVPGMIEGVKADVDEAFVADVETLTLTSSFDRVMCSGVLDFVVDPARAFGNLCRLTDLNGLLVVQVPRNGVWGWMYRADKARWRIKVNLFTVEWLERHARTNGLRVASVSYPLPYNMVVAFRRVAPGHTTEPRA
jgi:ubiquinone/menaquinone biosynthesis C-methylase UbiE/putative flippase GtrA